MSNYEKQNFVSGQILKAEHLNHMEDGIGQLSEEKADQFTVGEGLQMSEDRVLSAVGGGSGGGFPGVVVNFTTQYDSEYSVLGFTCDKTFDDVMAAMLEKGQRVWFNFDFYLVPFAQVTNDGMNGGDEFMSVIVPASALNGNDGHTVIFNQATWWRNTEREWVSLQTVVVTGANVVIEDGMEVPIVRP